MAVRLLKERNIKRVSDFQYMNRILLSLENNKTSATVSTLTAAVLQNCGDVYVQ